MQSEPDLVSMLQCFEVCVSKVAEIYWGGYSPLSTPSSYTYVSSSPQVQSLAQKVGVSQSKVGMAQIFSSDSRTFLLLGSSLLELLDLDPPLHGMSPQSYISILKCHIFFYLTNLVHTLILCN